MKIKCRNHYHDGNTTHLVIKTMNNRGCLRRRKTKVITSFLVIHEKKNKPKTNRKISFDDWNCKLFPFAINNGC